VTEDPRKLLTFVDERCSVTMFDMHFEVSRDGRDRGIWFLLRDESEERAATYKRWLEGAVQTFCEIVKGTTKASDEVLLKFSGWMNLNDEVGQLLNGKVNEAALIEWPALKGIYEKLGEAIREHEEKEGPIRGRSPRKPDRRARERRVDDKRKAKLRR
jgi:hypothetical protein